MAAEYTVAQLVALLQPIHDLPLEALKKEFPEMQVTEIEINDLPSGDGFNNPIIEAL